MANWCKHFEMGGWLSSNTCNVSGKSETIPGSYEYYCKNDAASVNRSNRGVV